MKYLALVALGAFLLSLLYIPRALQFVKTLLVYVFIGPLTLVGPAYLWGLAASQTLPDFDAFYWTLGILVNYVIALIAIFPIGIVVSVGVAWYRPFAFKHLLIVAAVASTIVIALLSSTLVNFPNLLWLRLVIGLWIGLCPTLCCWPIVQRWRAKSGTLSPERPEIAA